MYSGLKNSRKEIGLGEMRPKLVWANNLLRFWGMPACCSTPSRSRWRTYLGEHQVLAQVRYIWLHLQGLRQEAEHQQQEGSCEDRHDPQTPSPSQILDNDTEYH